MFWRGLLLSLCFQYVKNYSMNTKPITKQEYIILAVTAGTTKHGTPFVRLQVADFDTKFEISVWGISKNEITEWID